MKRLEKDFIFFRILVITLVMILCILFFTNRTFATSNEHIISFDANGGTVDTKTKTLSTGDLYGELPIPSREGYTFNGWYISNYLTATSENPFYDDYFDRNVLRLSHGGATSNGNFKIGYTLVFDVTIENTVPIGVDINDNDLNPNDGNFVIEGNRVYGKVTINNSHYSRWGKNSYSFLDINCQNPVEKYTVNEFRLYTNTANGEKIKEDTVFNETNDVRLYADWTKIVYYTVGYEMNGADKPIEPQSVMSGDKAIKPENPTKRFCLFDGWYSDEDLTKEFDFETPITEDITIFAKWIPNYQDVTLALKNNMVIDGENSLGEGGLLLEFFLYKGIITYEEADNDMEYFYNKDGKLLFTYNEETFTLNLGENVTFLDNIIYVLTEEDKELLEKYEIYVNKFILWFGDPIEYVFLNGANQQYIINESNTATFEINADYSLFKNDGTIYIDGTLVNNNNYTSKAGSTIITFTKEYMSSLSNGEHTLKVAFKDGGTATTKFTVATAIIEKGETNTLQNPKTGDNIVIWISLMVISILCIARTAKSIFLNIHTEN